MHRRDIAQHLPHGVGLELRSDRVVGEGYCKSLGLAQAAPERRPECRVVVGEIDAGRAQRDVPGHRVAGARGVQEHGDAEPGRTQNMDFTGFVDARRGMVPTGIDVCQYAVYQ